MGAALTYARRHALFTLAGIAGEDDLDAPDLAVQTVDPSPKSGPRAKEHGSNGAGTPAPAKTFPGSRKGTNGTPPSNLTSEASAILRDQLLAELDKSGIKDDLDAWTLRAWPMANTLTLADGDKVREAFQGTLGRLQTIADEVSADGCDPRDPLPHRLQCPWRGVCVTRRTRALWPNSLAWSADGSHAIPTICGLCNPAVSASRSATNSRSRSAGRIIANCTAPARKQTGGRRWESSRGLRARAVARDTSSCGDFRHAGKLRGGAVIDE
jgi:hypothetical protein